MLAKMQNVSAEHRADEWHRMNQQNLAVSKKLISQRVLQRNVGKDIGVRVQEVDFTSLPAEEPAPGGVSPGAGGVSPGAASAAPPPPPLPPGAPMPMRLPPPPPPPRLAIRVVTFGLIKIGKTFRNSPAARELTERFQQIRGGAPVPADPATTPGP